jgi:hypothetical protein
MGKHRGQPDRGGDFDAQFNQSKARGDQKREQGRGIYSADKYLQDAGQVQPAQGNSESCGKATVILLSLLGGAAWGVSEVVSRLA